MKLSLVMATVERTEEIGRFLEGLAYQGQPELELIVVDQNPDERLVPVLRRYDGVFEIVHLKSGPGLSRARNVGLDRVSGEFVGFPDDDCWYPPKLVNHLLCWFNEHEDFDGLAVTSRDTQGRFSNLHWDREPGVINQSNLMRRAISY